MFTFDSKIEFGNKILGNEHQVKHEPMLFSCNKESAWGLGGPITRSFLLNLSDEFRDADDLIIDSRVHMLMPGWYPCIPGYHHDDVPREREDGQPNYHNPSYKAKHCMMLINGGIAPTKFALGKATFSDIPLGEKYYKEWHKDVEMLIRSRWLKEYDAESNKLIYFDWQTWHKGVQAVKGGWRFFIRATINTGRKPVNEVRKQVQVYLENPMEGW